MAELFQDAAPIQLGMTFNQVNKGIFAISWFIGLIPSLHKAGDNSNCGIYRGTAVAFIGSRL